MNNRDKIVDNYIETIDEILLSWGYVKKSSEYDKQLATIKEWLVQFEPNEIPLAILILKNIQYYDEKKIRTIVIKLSEKLPSILGDISNALFFPLGNSSSSSGGLYLYLYRKELNLPEDNFKMDDFRNFLHQDIDIVFFDDIIGSGKQATTFYCNNLDKGTARIHYIALMGFDHGIQYILDNASYKNVIVGQILTKQDLAFSEESTIFGSNKQQIKSLCLKYGEKLFPGHPLGYNDSQALIVFPHTVPNNTLPIIWAGTNNEGRQSNLLWTPLFKRIKPYYNKKNDKSNFKKRIIELFYNAGFDLFDIKEDALTIVYINNMYSYKICVHYIFSVTTNSIVSDINKILNQYNYGDSPSLIQFWIMANFNPQISNILEGLQQQYGINIILNSARDLSYFEVGCKIFQEYIIKKLPRVIDDTSIDEYYSRISKSDHYLVDRDYERHLLSSNQFSSYYIIGLSFSGKTQLLKNVIKEYADKNYPIFWHTVISNDSNIQYRTLIISLGHYFIHRHKESKLNAYLDKYGCGISGELFSLITMLLKSYKPIVIIDDIHKCNSENLKFKQIIELFIQESECRLYMAGWFNIFNTNIEIRKNVRFITLNGLSYEYLNQIIKNRIGCSRIQIAQEIEKKYSGLPGYAELVEQTTNIKALGNVNSYFTSFIKSLTYNEQLVLFMLGYVSVPLHITYFENLNLLDELYVLAQKKLIREEGEYYSVHDTYRSFLTNYSVNQNLFSEILTLADTIISKNYRAALDIINICINKRKYIEAYTIISNEFELFIQHQIFYELLQYLQLIESADVSINGLDLLFKKVLLLERINDYQLCISYICLISSDLKASDEIKYIYCLYVYMRCLYFTNKYDDIIKIYKENSDYIINSSDKKILCQILLLVGRIFYIRGDLDTAGTIYVLAYQLGFGNKVLENKVIYRIGMVEYKKGLIEESAKTFSQLLKSNLYLTPKRKSYIYNKLARSYIELGNIIQAQYNNDESLKIKKIYNDERGIIFCCKIQARILLYQHKLLEAMMVLEKAEELSIKLKLNKELLSIHMMQITIKLKYNNVNADKLLPLLDNCIAICEKEKLLSKLCIISNICNIYYPNLRERIDRIKNDIQKYNQIEANLILNQFENIFSTISKSWVQSIKSSNCISHQMLQLSRFI